MVHANSGVALMIPASRHAGSHHPHTHWTYWRTTDSVYAGSTTHRLLRLKLDLSSVALDEVDETALDPVEHKLEQVDQVLLLRALGC